MSSSSWTLSSRPAATPASNGHLSARALGAYSTSNPSTVSVLPSALFQATASSSSSIDLFPTGVESSSSSSSFDLFPTGYTTSAGGSSNGTSSGSSDRSGGTAPGLYLIVFLSVLVLLLVTSVSVALRAIFVRRRSRSLIQRAIARGELPPSAAGANTFGAGGWRAWFGWPEEDDDDEVREMVLAWHGLGGTGVDGATGRRRRGNKLGPPPKLFEYALAEGKQLHDADLDGGMPGDERWYHENPPMSATLLKRAKSASQGQSRSAEGYSSAATPAPPIVSGTTTSPTSPPGRSRYNISRPLHLESASTSRPVGTDGSRSTTIPVAPSGVSPGDTLSMSYIIAMPEPPMATAARRARMEDDEEDRAGHGPMELGVLIEVVRESQADELFRRE